MSIFHRTIKKVSKLIAEENWEELDKVIEKHILEINEEFHIDRKVHDSLVEYYEILKLIKNAHTKLLKEGKASPKDWHIETLKKQVKTAHDLITQIHEWLMELDAKHKFLK